MDSVNDDAFERVNDLTIDKFDDFRGTLTRQRKTGNEREDRVPAELAEKISEITKLLEVRNSQLKEHEDSQKQLQQLETELSASEAQRNEVEVQVNDLKNILDDLSKKKSGPAFEEKKGIFEARIAAIEKVIEDQKKRREEYREKLNTASEMVDGEIDFVLANESMDRQTERIAAIESETLSLNRSS